MASKHAKQYNLFEEQFEEKQFEKDTEQNFPLNKLQISKNDTKKESKLKKLISSRLKKIEKLKSLLQKDKKTLETIKSSYDEILKKPIHEVSVELEKYMEKLVNRYAQKSFSMTQKDTLEYLIEDCIELFMQRGHTSEKLDQIIENYENINKEIYGDEADYEEEFGDEFDEDFEDEDTSGEFEKEFIRMMLEGMGLDLGADFFKDLDPKDPDFQEKFQQRVFEHADKQKAKKQTEDKRQKTLTTDKEFTKLYKNLVKKVHPDLTTDEDERSRREELMKELSTIWEKRDYYELLVIQSKISKDSQIDIEVNKNQLQQIADDLLEKVREAESERFMFKKHPDNDFYFSNFFASSENKIKFYIENYKRKILKEKKEIAKNILKLKTQKTTKKYLKAIDEKLEDENIFGYDFF